MIGVELDAGLRLAVSVGGLVHHVYLFFGLHTSQIAVVAHTDEQAPTVGIGKGRHRLGQLAGIGHAVLEILLLVLALTDEAEKIALVVHIQQSTDNILRPDAAHAKENHPFLGYPFHRLLTQQ